MTDQNNQEPTMEEILASIRRIISEDDAPAAASDEAPPHGDEVSVTAHASESAAPPVLEAAEEPHHEEEVLELTDRVDAPPAPPAMESVGDLDVFSSAPARPAPVAAPLAAEDVLVGAPAAGAAASAFAALTQTITMPKDGRDLEDVVRELLRPLMKQWLDENLPRIVESAVQTEVERIARRHG